MWQSVRAFVSETKWGNAQALLTIAKQSRDFPMLPSSSLLQAPGKRRNELGGARSVGGVAGDGGLAEAGSGREADLLRERANVPRSFDKLVDAMRKAREDDEWSEVCALSFFPSLSPPPKGCPPSLEGVKFETMRCVVRVWMTVPAPNIPKSQTRPLVSTRRWIQWRQRYPPSSGPWKQHKTQVTRILPGKDRVAKCGKDRVATWLMNQMQTES